MKAMILAAGQGTRLLPYTLKRPKPLFPVLNQPLLGLTINRIKQAGCSEIVVNAHHLRSQIKKALEPETGIVLQEEKKILGTGGGLRLALDHFGSEPFLVVNGDIYHTVDYRKVYRSHRETGPDVTLVLHDCPRFNNVAVAETGEVAGFDGTEAKRKKGARILAFTGIQVINPEVLRAIPLDTNSCIIERYRKLLVQGGTIRAYVASGHFWTDMGTPADYLQLHQGLLEKKIPLYEELMTAARGAPFVGWKKVAAKNEIKLLDWVCIGRGARIGPGATLQRSVVWDEAVVPAGSVIKDAIVTS